jgi:integrase
MTTLAFPRTHKNIDVRSREYLTEAEVDRLMKAARTLGRHGHRNEAMILLAHRHALRVLELVSLRWDQVRLQEAQIHVYRLKRGYDSVHPLTGKELRMLRQLQRQQFPLMIYESSVTMIADSSLSVSTIRVRFLKRLSRPDGLNVVLKVDRSLEVGIAFPP